MMYRDAFCSYHPLVNILFFLQVILYAMLFMHPVCLFISFFCAFSYAICLNGKKTLRFGFIYLLPMLLLTLLLNPLFSNQGVTVLTYLPGGNPVTLESIVYGIAAAFMLITVISWFSCYNAVMTSDKFMYLFGRVIPSLSLVLSMALRFVPRFKAQIKVIADAQRCIGRDVSQGGLLKRARCGVRILSIMATWTLENAIETADSMKSRGYGLPGRTAFSVFRLDKRDRKALVFLAICGVYIVIGAICGGLDFYYYPMLWTAWSPYAASLFAVYAVLCALPLIINRKEAYRWKAAKAVQASK